MSIYGALFFHARAVVQAAAQDALSAAQLEGGTEQDGVNAANNALSLSQNLVNVQVDVDENSSEIRVVVSAEVESIPLSVLAGVSAEAIGPKERFYSYEERAS